MSDRPLLRVAEAASLVFPGKPRHPATRTLYRWVSQGVIPEVAVFKDGRSIWFRRCQLEAWMQGQQMSGNQEKMER